MGTYTKETVKESIKQMRSLIAKSEKARLKLTPKTSAHTLLTRRLVAFNMALELLLEKETSFDQN